MNSNVFKRVSAVLLAMFVAFGMMCFGTWEAKAADSWDLQGSDSYFAGNEVYVEVGSYDQDGNYAWGDITSVKSSKKSVVKSISYPGTDENGKSIKVYYLKFVKAGTAKVTVKFKKPDGSKGSLTKTIKVKKYPNQLKSLKVNGKKVKTSKGDKRYIYFADKFKKSKVTVKMSLKKGWKVSSVSGYAFNSKSGKNKDIKIKKSVIKKGTGIKFPKGCDNLIIDITMQNGNKEIPYQIYVSKN